MSRSIKILFLIITLVFLCPQKAKAIDPVTMVVLAPAALKVANSATPYLVRVAKNTTKGLIKIGKDVFEIFYLPYGLGKMTIGYPFGGFRSGVVYTIKGAIAPGKLVVHTVLLPAYMVGLEVNI